MALRLSDHEVFRLLDDAIVAGPAAAAGEVSERPSGASTARIAADASVGQGTRSSIRSIYMV